MWGGGGGEREGGGREREQGEGGREGADTVFGCAETPERVAFLVCGRLSLR